MTLRKLRLQARYNVLTPAALIGFSSALLLGSPALAFTGTFNGTTTALVIDAGGTLTNNGTINGGGPDPAVSSNGDVVSIINASGGLIQGFSQTGIYLTHDVGSVTNNGTITSYTEAGVAIYGDVTDTFANTGTIAGTWAGVFVSGDVGTFTNSNEISGATYGNSSYGVEIQGDVGTFTNNGTITATGAYNCCGANGVGVYIGGDVLDAFTNTKTISATDSYYGYGVEVAGDIGSFNNSGTISASSNAYGYGAYVDGHVGTFTNSGTISTDNNNYGAYAVYIDGGVDTFVNSASGTIHSDYTAVEIYGNVGNFTNSGTISGESGYGVEMYFGTVDSFTNSGTISSGNDAGVYMYGVDVTSFNNTSTGVITGTWAGVYIDGNVESFTNAGTISGEEYGVELYTSNASILNTGTISGGSDSGVYVSGSNNVLTNSGTISSANYYYAVDLDGSDNTLKLLTGGSFIGAVWFGNNGTFDFSQYHGNMRVDTGGSVPNIVNGDNLYYQDPDQVVIVGDSSVTNSSHPVSDITNGINSLITDQLDFGTGGGGDTGPLGFAPVRVNSAAEMATAKALAPRSKDGQVFWAQGTAGGSSNGVDASDVFGALVVGTHVQLQDGLRAGGLGAYAHSVATTDFSQTITADTGIIGAYGRADLDTVSLDFSVLAGASTNASARTVAGPGGPETASATFGGWFINPTVGVSMPVLSTDKGDLSVIGSVGYLLGGFGGYTETGSSANLTVGAQTIGILDAAFGVKGKKDLGSNEHGVIVGKGTAEIFAESNVGTSTVPITVLGTTIGNALPPSALALGVRSSLSIEVPISDNVSFTGAGTASVRSNGLISGAATARISGTF